MKRIDVVCGVVYNKDSEILITQRADETNYKKWEFPGGKVKEGESLETSIQRELREELNIQVQVKGEMYRNYHGRFCLLFIECHYLSGYIELREHLDYRWVPQRNLKQYDFLEGDWEFISTLT